MPVTCQKSRQLTCWWEWPMGSLPRVRLRLNTEHRLLSFRTQTHTPSCSVYALASTFHVTSYYSTRGWVPVGHSRFHNHENSKCFASPIFSNFPNQAIQTSALIATMPRTPRTSSEKFDCPHCGRSFNRLEHLQRHIRTRMSS